jgi:large subunit ribosomal protein L11
MAKKQVKAVVKLLVTGGQANPAPPVGPALGQHGVNIGEFVKQFNERTKKMMGVPLPAVITVFTDRSFTFITKQPPASVLIRQAASLAKGSATPNKEKVGKISAEQLRSIAQQKMVDLNAGSVEAAMRIIAGTARSMGVEITGNFEASAKARARVKVSQP